MLRVAKLRAGGGGYYLEVAQGTGTGVEAAGEWVGTGGEQLGLHGTVSGEAFTAVLSGRHPASAEALLAAHRRVTVAGFDLTFCAPKSVSLLSALAAPEVVAEVRAGHRAAVDGALSYVERHAAAVRRRSGGRRLPVPTDGVTAAAFVHRLSRALDPHLHTHVVVANLGHGPEGTWSALDGRGLYAHASAAGALYHALLRHELTARLGVTWGPLDRGRADVAGIGTEAVRAFSRRAAAIAEHVAARGRGADDPSTGRLRGPAAGQPGTPRARQVAAHVTRPARDVHVAAEDLRAGWEARALAAGLGPRRLDAVVDRVPRRRGPGRDPAAHLEAALDATSVLVVPGARVSRRHVVRAVCASLPAGGPAAVVEAATDRVMASLAGTDAHARHPSGPGMGERRYVVAGAARGATGGDRAPDLERLLAARGMARASPAPRERARPGHDRGLGLG